MVTAVVVHPVQVFLMALFLVLALNQWEMAGHLIDAIQRPLVCLVSGFLNTEAEVPHFVEVVPLMVDTQGL